MTWSQLLKVTKRVIENGEKICMYMYIRAGIYFLSHLFFKQQNCMQTYSKEAH